jgi:hypothetical protein
MLDVFKHSTPGVSALHCLREQSIVTGMLMADCRDDRRSQSLFPKVAASLTPANSSISPRACVLDDGGQFRR